METAKNVNQIIIATAADANATTIADLAAGEIAIAHPNGVIVTANAYANADLATGDKYIIAAKGATSGVLQISDVITKGSEVIMEYNAYSASTPKIEYIGYDGVTATKAIEAINSNVYSIRLMLRDNTTSSFQRDLIKEGFYKSDATATAAEVALGLTKSLVKNFSREAEPIILFERVNSGTSVATSAGTLTFTKGSKYVSWVEDGTNNDAGKYDTDASSVAVGDYIRVGHATTATYPVYGVVAVTGSANTTIVLELDMEYQGASEVVAAAKAGVIPAASLGNFGIKLTGQKKSFVKGVFNSDSYVSWDTILQDFGTTTLTQSQAQSNGIGTYEWVAEKEFEFQMKENFYRIAQPTPSYKQDASSSSTYGVFVIQYKDEMDTVLGGQADSLKTLYVACVTAGCENVEEVLGINVP